MANLPITAYTSTDAVRGAVGLTDNELLDETLVDQKLDTELEVDLQQWVPTHATIFAEGTTGTPTSEQTLKASYLQLYAQWYVASQILSVMALAIPQMISDGQNEMRRFQQADLEALSTTAGVKAAFYKKLLSDATGIAAASRPALIVAGVPDYDPVTGV